MRLFIFIPNAFVWSRDGFMPGAPTLGREAFTLGAPVWAERPGSVPFPEGWVGKADDGRVEVMAPSQHHG